MEIENDHVICKYTYIYSELDSIRMSTVNKSEDGRRPINFKV